MPNNTSTISTQLLMLTTIRSPVCIPSDISPLATRFVVLSNSLQLNVVSPAMTAGSDARHLPHKFRISGNNGLSGISALKNILRNHFSSVNNAISSDPNHAFPILLMCSCRQSDFMVIQVSSIVVVLSADQVQSLILSMCCRLIENRNRWWNFVVSFHLHQAAVCRRSLCEFRCADVARQNVWVAVNFQ